MSECDDCLCTQALEGGCVLDLCLVRWPSEDWCICVAGEWRVCLWAQMKGVQSWSLLHTWTFAQVNQFVKWQHKFKELQADKNNNSVIIYSFSCCSKPLRLWLIIETWIELYLKITYEIYTVYKIFPSDLTCVCICSPSCLCKGYQTLWDCFVSLWVTWKSQKQGDRNGIIQNSKITVG